MCYIVAKRFDTIGCLTLKSEHGSGLVEFMNRLESYLGDSNVQLVVISNPQAYGEYAPYILVKTEKEFEEGVKSLVNK